MANSQSVEKGDEYIHVRYRDPDDFDEIRTPDWAAKVGDSVAPGSEVRMGQEKGDDDWAVQSVLLRAENTDEDEAKRLADDIVEKIRS